MRNIFVIISLLIFSTIALAIDNSKVLRKAEAGDLKALKQAFILHTKTDGADAEEIDISIGKSIRRNPKNFLSALKQNRSKVPRLDLVLGNLGYDYVDDLKKQKKELGMRLIAIRSVNDKGLKVIRAECEIELKEQIKKRFGD